MLSLSFIILSASTNTLSMISAITTQLQLCKLHLIFWGAAHSLRICWATPFCCLENISPQTPYCSLWQFNSAYELQLQTISDESGTSQLTKLLTKSGSTGVFYVFDPSFYTLMKALSSSLELTFFLLGWLCWWCWYYMLILKFVLILSLK